MRARSAAKKAESTDRKTLASLSMRFLSKSLAREDYANIVGKIKEASNSRQQCNELKRGDQSPLRLYKAPTNSAWIPCTEVKLVPVKNQLSERT